jgi:hypothetical protein
MLDWLLIRLEAPTDRLIAWRNERMLAAALDVHGAEAEYTVSEPTQIQTPGGPRLTRRGEKIRTALEPNQSLIPMNEAARVIHRMWSRKAGSFIIIDGKPIAKTASERAEHVERIRG